MANILVLLVIAGCVAYQFLKGSLVKAFATIIVTICASAVAFGYFEPLANLLVSRSRDSDYQSLILWAQPLSFVLLFILSFAILQTIASWATRQEVDLGLLPERIGRIVCGIFLGLLISGILLTALAMAPIPNKYPYQRFDETNPDAERPSKALLNADGFATGWFSMLSDGSFGAIRNKRSFAALHPDFLNQVFLNRHNISDTIPIMTSSQAIELPGTKEMPCWWLASEDIKDQDGNSLRKAGYDITIVRVGIKRSEVKQAGTFTLSQLRLICKEKDFENPVTGKAKNIYPIGYLKAQNQLQKKKLTEKIKIPYSDFDDRVKWIDFAFYVPADFAPALVEFKLNSIAEAKASAPATQPPPVAPLLQPSDKEKEKLNDSVSEPRGNKSSTASSRTRPQ